jgi:hypothetical protein
LAKKGLLLAVLIAVAAGNVSAQEGGFSVFVSTLGAGLRFEWFIDPQVSIGPVSYINSNLFNDYFELHLFGAFGRYYPQLPGNLPRGIFVELGLGLHYQFPPDGSDSDENIGLAISPGLGWKISNIGISGDFYIEPGISVPLIIGSSGRSVGFMIYVGFGWAGSFFGLFNY